MDYLFENIYKGKKVLITGNTGFKGSWLSLWLKQLGAEVIGYSLDPPSVPSHFQLLKMDIDTVHGDILDPEKLHKCFEKYKPEIVFHLAAQSLVRDSYRNPVITYSSNVIGTLNVLEAARKSKSVKAIVNVTTDKVYENLEQDLAYAENDRLGGYDIYSSSKACSELLSTSYRNSFLNLKDYKKTHQILLATARAGNVIGGGDWATERLIPDVIKASLNKEKTKIRNSNSVRPWQHVLEPLSGYLLLGQKLLEEKQEYACAWNFGPDIKQCIPVSELLKLLKRNWGQIIWENYDDGSGFHEAKMLKLDSSKAINVLGWKPVFSIDATASLTINWYRKFYEEKSIVSFQDIEFFVNQTMEPVKKRINEI